MANRQTPFMRINYPWASDVVTVVDVENTASDIDQGLVQTAAMAANFARMSSVIVQRTGAAQSIAKGSLTTITFDSVVLDNGADSPLANGAWYKAATPTRLTAPSPCIVLATGYVGMNFTSALGTAGCLQVTISINGGSGSPNVQGNKFYPVSTATGQHWASVLSMWKLDAGDYLELKVYWTGTPAGPFSTDTAIDPTMSLSMVALPSVA